MSEILKTCAKHGELTADNIWSGSKDGYLRCRLCSRESRRFYEKQHPDKVKGRHTATSKRISTARAMAATFPEVFEIFKSVYAYFDYDTNKLKYWWSQPNPLLGNIIPKDMIMTGELKELTNFVNQRLKSED